MEKYTTMTVRIPKGMTEDISNYITSVTGGDAYLSIDSTSKKEVVWVPIKTKQNQKGRVMAKLHSREIIKKAKTELMDEFIMKVNMYGVRKFRREGINNPELLYQIKHHDHTIRVETIEKYIELINKLIERDKKGIAV